MYINSNEKQLRQQPHKYNLGSLRRVTSGIWLIDLSDNKDKLA